MVPSANSLSANMLVTGAVLAPVFVLPFADRRISRRAGLSLHGGISTNPHAERLEQNGITPGLLRQDAYSTRKCVRFSGPDGTEITVPES